MYDQRPPIVSPPEKETVESASSTSAPSNWQQREQLRLEKRRHEFIDQMHETFSLLDTDCNDFVTAREIDTAMVDPDIHGNDAAALLIFKKYRTALEELSNDERWDENSGVTRSDLDVYAKTGQMPRSKDYRHALVDEPTLEQQYGLYNRDISNIDPSLFGETGKDVHVSYMRQGEVGDCSFIAAMMSLAAIRPEEIYKMIKDNGDKTYTVTLPGQKPLPIKAPTDAENAYYASSGLGGIWLSLLEKAYGQLKNPDASIDAEGVSVKGYPLSEGLSFATGNEAKQYPLWRFSQSEMKILLDDAFANKKIVTALVKERLFKKRLDGLPDHHIYAITDWKNEELTIRNPWKKGEIMVEQNVAWYGDNDGLFRLKLPQFYYYFNGIGIEQ